jgi:hypothetical protein
MDVIPLTEVLYNTFVISMLLILAAMSVYLVFKKEIKYRYFIPFSIFIFILGYSGFIRDSFLVSLPMIGNNTNSDLYPYLFLLISTFILTVNMILGKNITKDKVFTVSLSIIILSLLFLFHLIFVNAGAMHSLKTIAHDLKSLTLKSPELISLTCEETPLVCYSGPVDGIDTGYDVIDKMVINDPYQPKPYRRLKVIDGNTMIYTNPDNFIAGGIFTLVARYDGEGNVIAFIERDTSMMLFFGYENLFMNQATIATVFWFFMGYFMLFMHKSNRMNKIKRQYKILRPIGK